MWVLPGAPFAHEKLEVYNLALDFVAPANPVVEQLPRAHGHLGDQLERASTSIVLDLAEGAGEFSKPDKKRRYDLIAVSLTTESAAILAGEHSRLCTPDERRHESCFDHSPCILTCGI